MMKMWKQQKELYWLIVFAVCCFGGFYDWTATLIGVAVCVVAICRVKKKGQIQISKEVWIYFILLQGVGLLFAMITAVDRGMNLVGIVRFLPIAAWLFLSMQYEKEDRERALLAVPHTGCLMILVGGISLLIPGLKDWLWAADRLGGFFQYSNTCAIYFLVGMMLLRKKKTRSEKIQWCLLFWGILLTGSRTVMILLIILLMKELLDKNKDTQEKRLIGVNVGVAVFAAAVMVFVTGNYQNLARLATIFTSNSTLYGRLLYWKDALTLIVRYPFGLGWKGYYYIQPAVQTGVYTTMYVHNDLLQAFLDGGWIAGVSLGVFVLQQMKKSQYRFILSFVFLHSLVDFDLQYIVIWLIVILMCDFGKKNVLYKKEGTRNAKLALGITAAVFIYFLIPFGADFFEDYETAIAFYPGYTHAKEQVLARTGNAEAAVLLADEILAQNAYSTLAYDAKALASYAKGDIYGFAENKKKVLQIERYDITHYQDYQNLLIRYSEYAKRWGDTESVVFCRERVEEIPNLLKDVEKETSVLAWKLRDQPNFRLE